MKFSTGGKAHEPQGMIRCNSEADSIVWMKEEKLCAFPVGMYCIKLESKLWNSFPELFLFCTWDLQREACNFDGI